MTTATTFPTAPDASANDYLIVGFATCYTKEDGEVKEVTIIEPVPSAYLEAIFKNVPTSYKSLHATTLGAVVNQDQPQMLEGAEPQTQFCEDFVTRAFSASRTYRSRPTAKEFIPVGQTRTDINYSTERKRVLNAENIVRTEDNVKQHSHTHKVL